MAQCLRLCAVLIENPSLVLTTHIGQLKTTLTLVEMDLLTPSSAL